MKLLKQQSIYLAIVLFALIAAPTQLSARILDGIELGGIYAFQYEKPEGGKSRDGAGAHLRTSVLVRFMQLRLGVTGIADMRTTSALSANYFLAAPFLRIGNAYYIDVGGGYSKAGNYNGFGYFGAVGAMLASSFSIAYYAQFRDYGGISQQFSSGPLINLHF